ncbi:MAG: carboxypeptidase-like regulatory domain-containing protein [Bacteroidia bacterium]|nr:carboxypeptidase-like regulatory domain-containing protein [Bacteroidia bacterium]NND26215.1 carboxypeptidase-like regulatory domain-containing protein [Flavobacteriaceae bacterium]MBT8277593.1 carboxypeptidase-like regulatory domain-containing protein [Bacteroidia bacterium]NNK59347.1 carboxypeptidase-like regulatory domain-containing protein [Flavobacteriaceae bacterium]NNL33370.1 carboxypeptidase-like regulatory domain-containing protein [Flavobacteriaceae bacterium]
MTRLLLFISMMFLTIPILAQEDTSVSGTVRRAGTITPLENVNIVNLSQVKGTATNDKGEFIIKAKANDTLHFSYLGYKSIKVRVTNDWIKFGQGTTIEMTELALALEEVVVNQIKLTGYLEVDIKQVPLNRTVRYSISGLPTTGYEGGTRSPNAVTKVLGAIFNPADFLHKIFGKTPNELRKLRKMKKDDEIRNLLATRFDREMLAALLQLDKVDLDLIVSECNYSKEFIQTANDLQILDAISECYEEYKVLSRNKSRL